ncbi:CDP-alcohol phosphatidyltransferase family protein [Paenibacillus thermoaerophilus]|uniref:CDP-diacylglycerol--glycerol-3-phosphate 3-phosphatidyltransferase n=1 Tax=Paenibacillus thermoaerophilus TaxID=1215385 RepID=A0ABW2V8G9_9BACL|nr:CDP-alcohol phosphatidyltransferase family protein [Paenibacillus thermoaerophilus]
MNLPNLLTIGRLLMIPLYLFLFFAGHPMRALVVLFMAGATDVLDGYLARRRGQVTSLGSMLDPLADKLMLLAVVLSLLIGGWIPWQAAAAMALRDAGMIAGSAFFHFRGKMTVPANAMGKLTTVFYYIAILFIFFKVPIAIPFLWGVIGLSFVTSAVYILLFRNLNDMGQTKKSI